MEETNKGVPRRQKLTDAEVERLRPDAVRQYDVWETMLPPFGVRVSPKGKKAFTILYRFHGKVRRHTVGDSATMAIERARNIARDILHDKVDQASTR